MTLTAQLLPSIAQYRLLGPYNDLIGSGQGWGAYGLERRGIFGRIVSLPIYCDTGRALSQVGKYAESVRKGETASLRAESPSMGEAASSRLEAARAALSASDFRQLERLGRELVEVGARDGEVAVEAHGYHHLGIALWNLNRGGEAAAATQTAIRLYEAAGDRFSAAKAMMNLGSIGMDNRGDPAEARRLYERNTPILRELGGGLNLGVALGNLGEICRLEGDYRGAIAYAKEALAIFRSLEDTGNAAWMLICLGQFELQSRHRQRAFEMMREAYAMLEPFSNPRWVALYFDTWFLIAVDLQQYVIAAQLLAFADKYRDEHNQPRLQAMLPWLSTPRERLARELSGERHDACATEGEALTIQTAQRLAETLAVG